MIVKPPWWRQVWDDLRTFENIDSMVVVALAVFVTVREVFSGGVAQSLQLALLAGIAWGFLRIRQELAFRSTREVVEFRDKHPKKVAELAIGASKVCLLGVNLHGTLQSSPDLLRDLARRGCAVAIVITDSDVVGEKALGDRFTRRPDLGKFGEAMRATRAHVKRVADEFPAANVTLTLVPFVPPFGMTLVTNDRWPNWGGEAQVEVYGFASKHGAVPKFSLSRRSDPVSFAQFAAQFEEMRSLGICEVPKAAPAIQDADTEPFRPS